MTCIVAASENALERNVFASDADEPPGEDLSAGWRRLSRAALA